MSGVRPGRKQGEAMSIQSKNHHASDTVEARVSQGSRQMAQPSEIIRGREFPSLNEERDWLVIRKKEIDLQLSTTYSKSAYSKAQMKIRGHCGGTSRTLTEWLRKRAQLDACKAKLNAEKLEIEKRLNQLHGLLRAEAAVSRPGGESENEWQLRKSNILLEMADDLAAVRGLLERLVERLGA
jgi:hypothetical protein